jgi:hypothetical protein
MRRGEGRLGLAIGALGVVFGDIGTNPLYTVQTVFSPAAADADVPASAFPPSGLRERILDRCRSIVGQSVVAADWSMGHGEALVLALTDPAGRQWVAKAIRRKKDFDRELTAYQHSAHAFGDRVPELRWYDAELRMLLLSRLNGITADKLLDRLSPEILPQVGQLTRVLHDSMAPCPTSRSPSGGATAWSVI